LFFIFFFVSFTTYNSHRKSWAQSHLLLTRLTPFFYACQVASSFGDGEGPCAPYASVCLLFFFFLNILHIILTHTTKLRSTSYACRVASSFGAGEGPCAPERVVCRVVCVCVCVFFISYYTRTTKAELILVATPGRLRAASGMARGRARPTRV